MHELMIYDIRPSEELGPIGIGFTHDRLRPGELSGSFVGGLDLTCDLIASRGVAAVLSLTEEGIEPVSLPLVDFAAGVRARHMLWYHLPIRDRHVPGEAFEQGWQIVGEELRRLIRHGFGVLVHCEGNLCRSAMIIARLIVELGFHWRLPFDLLHEFRKGLFPGGETIGHVCGQEPVPEKRPSRDTAARCDRAVGAMLGLAVGDAVGTTLEFKARDSYPRHTDLTGGGPFGLAAGEWTDDTAMSLALAETLTEHDQYDDWGHRRQLMDEASAAFARSKQNSLAEGRLQRRIREAMRGEYPGNPRLFERALMERFTAWMDEGAYSCNGRCFDIGLTVRSALRRWQQTGDPIAGSIDPMTAGNGSLMRLAPVAIRYWNDPLRLADYAARQSRTTHGAPEAVDACIAYAHLLADAITGKCASEVLAAHRVVGPDREREYGERYKLYANSIEAILAGSWRGKRRDQIRGSGYVVQSLEAALWCVGRTSNFRDAVLLAANLGEDADTTAAITGQLAGALYGASGIPAEWLEKLAWKDEIAAKAQALFEASEQR